MKPLDYVLDNDDNFWIIMMALKDKAYGKMVFKVSDEGRYNKITKRYYTKVVNNKLDDYLLIKDIKRIFHPNECYRNSKEKLCDKWKQLSTVLEEIGIKENNIGIFGSYLIGFDVEHDIDYVVYGNESYKLVKENINYIQKRLKATSITNEHLEYQTNKYKKLYSTENEMSKILKHNWAGLQLGEGVLTTIRFIKQNNHYIDCSGKEMEIEGLVTQDKDTNFIPRVGVIKTNIGMIKVITCFWMFNAFLKKKERVLIKGIYNQERHELYLINDNHYIKYLS